MYWLPDSRRIKKLIFLKIILKSISNIMSLLTYRWITTYTPRHQAYLVSSSVKNEGRGDAGSGHHYRQGIQSKSEIKMSFEIWNC